MGSGPMAVAAMGARMLRDHSLSQRILLCALLASCTRYPDGKILCEAASDCPGSEFRYCRSDAHSDGRKLCFRAGEAEGAAGGGPATGGGGGRGGGEPSASRVIETGGSGGAAGDPPREQSGGGAPAPSQSGVGGQGGDAGRAGAEAGGGGRAGRTATAFQVSSSEPGEGATLQDVNAPLVVHFSEPIDKGSVTDVTFIILENGVMGVEGEREVADAQITFRPKPRWSLASSYEVVLSSSLFSRAQKPLPITHIKFRTRNGAWTAERVQTRESDSILFSAPQVAVSETGDVALAWDTLYRGSRHGGSRFLRRVESGWKELDSLTGLAAPLAMLDDGTAIYGSQPDDPGQRAQLTCADAQLNKQPLAMAPVMDGQTSSVMGLGLDLSDVHVLQYFAGSAPPYSQVRTRCAAGATADVTPLPAAQASPLSIAFAREGVAAWSQSAPAADGGMMESVWGLLRWAGPNCPQAPGCPRQLSSSERNADSAAIDYSGVSTAVVVWRELEASGSSIWVSQLSLSDDTWRKSVRLSAENVTAQAPAVALRGEDALAIWVEQQALERRVFGASYDAAAKRWSAPAPLSESFIVPDSSTPDAISPVIATSRGSWLVAWPQPSAQPGAYDIHATTFGFGQGWPGTQSTIISQNHLAGASVSVALDRYGRGYATWVESDAVWFGRSE